MDRRCERRSASARRDRDASYRCAAAHRGLERALASLASDRATRWLLGCKARLESRFDREPGDTQTRTAAAPLASARRMSIFRVVKWTSEIAAEGESGQDPDHRGGGKRKQYSEKAKKVAKCQ